MSANTTTETQQQNASSQQQNASTENKSVEQATFVTMPDEDVSKTPNTKSSASKPISKSTIDRIRRMIPHLKSMDTSNTLPEYFTGLEALLDKEGLTDADLSEFLANQIKSVFPAPLNAILSNAFSTKSDTSDGSTRTTPVLSAITPTILADSLISNLSTLLDDKPSQKDTTKSQECPRKIHILKSDESNATNKDTPNTPDLPQIKSLVQDVLKSMGVDSNDYDIESIRMIDESEIPENLRNKFKTINGVDVCVETSNSEDSNAEDSEDSEDSDDSDDDFEEQLRQLLRQGASACAHSQQSRAEKIINITPVTRVSGSSRKRSVNTIRRPVNHVPAHLVDSAREVDRCAQLISRFLEKVPTCEYSDLVDKIIEWLTEAYVDLCGADVAKWLNIEYLVRDNESELVMKFINVWDKMYDILDDYDIYNDTLRDIYKKLNHLCDNEKLNAEQLLPITPRLSRNKCTTRSPGEWWYKSRDVDIILTNRVILHVLENTSFHGKDVEKMVQYIADFAIDSLETECAKSMN